jgi:hypothetical protein
VSSGAPARAPAMVVPRNATEVPRRAASASVPPAAGRGAAAVLVDLRRDEMALHRSQDRLALLQTEAQRRCGMPGRRAPADADLVPLPRAVDPDHFQHHPLPHHVPGLQPPSPGHSTLRFWTVSLQNERMRQPSAAA